MRPSVSTLSPQVLADDVTLASTGYAEPAFFVVMAKPAPKAPKATPAPPPAPTKAKAEEGGSAPAAPGPAAEGGAAAAAAPSAAPAADAPAAPTPAPAAAPGIETGASALVTGSALEASVASICEMGFAREEVMRALRAAFNNPERAVEYLMTGIPEGVGGGGGGGGAGAHATAGAPAAPAAHAPAHAAPAHAPAGPNAQPLDMFAPPGAPGAAGARPAGPGGPLDFLRHHPQFRALRGVVQANPGVLHPMLQELGRQNPDLLALINAHQAEFLRLVNEPAGPEGDAGEAAAAALAAMEGGGPGGPGGPLPPGAVQIELTRDEADALGRLEALGFGRGACLEAYLACDKDETLAANYLFENPPGEEEEEEEMEGGGGGGGGA